MLVVRSARIAKVNGARSIWMPGESFSERALSIHVFVRAKMFCKPQSRRMTRMKNQFILAHAGRRPTRSDKASHRFCQPLIRLESTGGLKFLTANSWNFEMGG